MHWIPAGKRMKKCINGSTVEHPLPFLYSLTASHQNKPLHASYNGALLTLWYNGMAVVECNTGFVSHQ
jgi:hypothetical protein